MQMIWKAKLSIILLIDTLLYMQLYMLCFNITLWWVIFYLFPHFEVAWDIIISQVYFCDLFDLEASYDSSKNLI